MHPLLRRVIVNSKRKKQIKNEEDIYLSSLNFFNIKKKSTLLTSYLTSYKFYKVHREMRIYGLYMYT